MADEPVAELTRVSFVFVYVIHRTIPTQAKTGLECATRPSLKKQR
jgi:hypothetical protein